MLKNAINSKSFKLDKHNQNDFKRFIKSTNITDDGEIQQKNAISLHNQK